MSTFIKAYLGTQPLFTSDASTWVRPADWLNLPTASANTVGSRRGQPRDAHYPQ